MPKAPVTPVKSYESRSAPPSVAAPKRTDGSTKPKRTPGPTPGRLQPSPKIHRPVDAQVANQVALPSIKGLLKEVDARSANAHYNYSCCPAMPAENRRSDMIGVRGVDTFTFTHKSIEAQMHSVNARWHGQLYKPLVRPAIIFNSEVNGTLLPGVSVCDVYNGMDTLSFPNYAVFPLTRSRMIKIGIRLPTGPEYKYAFIQVDAASGCICGVSPDKGHKGTWTSHAIAWKVCTYVIPIVQRFKKVVLNLTEAIDCNVEQLRLAALDPEVIHSLDGSRETVLMARFFVVKEAAPSVQLPVQPYFIPREVEQCMSEL